MAAAVVGELKQEEELARASQLNEIIIPNAWISLALGQDPDGQGIGTQLTEDSAAGPRRGGTRRSAASEEVAQPERDEIEESDDRSVDTEPTQRTQRQKRHGIRQRRNPAEA